MLCFMITLFKIYFIRVALEWNPIPCPWDIKMSNTNRKNGYVTYVAYAPRKFGWNHSWPRCILSHLMNMNEK